MAARRTHGERMSHGSGMEDSQHGAAAPAPLDKYRVVMEWSQRLEHTLKTRLGATGTGLGEQWRSVEHALAPDLIAALREIAWIRNKVAHEADFEVPNLRALDEKCARVHDRLLQLHAIPSPPPRQQTPLRRSPQTDLVQGIRSVLLIGGLGLFGLFVLLGLLGAIEEWASPRDASSQPNRAGASTSRCSTEAARAAASEKLAAGDPCGARSSLEECCPDAIPACRVLRVHLERECSARE